MRLVQAVGRVRACSPARGARGVAQDFKILVSGQSLMDDRRRSEVRPNSQPEASSIAAKVLTQRAQEGGHEEALPCFHPSFPTPPGM